ncbi:MAG: hypothetical protein KF711_07680 [Nitrospira sp.]|nr:hypothetical protein [Nitrospira sp.]
MSHGADTLKLAQETEAELFQIREGKSFGNRSQPLQRIAAAIAIRFRIGQRPDAKSI